MTRKLEALNNWGCDVKGALERMLNDEDFYLECLQGVVNEPTFTQLEAALENNDSNAAFEAAHTLKGVLANVGLTPMYQKVVEIVEPLRTGKEVDLEGAFAQLVEEKQKLQEILSTE